MDVFSAVITLFLIMDPIGNVPLFLSVLKHVPVERRRAVLVREIGFAYLVLLGFFFLGSRLTGYLHLEPETIGIAGGIVLFLIAIRMIFHYDLGLVGEPLDGEPFLVPLAVPLLAGPSTLAALMLLEQSTGSSVSLFVAVSIAWAASGAILMASTFFYRVLRARGLAAMERLMGMVLVMVAVQMFMNGVKGFLGR